MKLSPGDGPLEIEVTTVLRGQLAAELVRAARAAEKSPVDMLADLVVEALDHEARLRGRARRHAAHVQRRVRRLINFRDLFKDYEAAT